MLIKRRQIGQDTLVTLPIRNLGESLKDLMLVFDMKSLVIAEKLAELRLFPHPVCGEWIKS